MAFVVLAHLLISASDGWRLEALHTLSKVVDESIAAAEAGRKAATGRARPNVYVVKKGDIGIMEIAREQLGSVRHWRTIVELNRLAPPYQVTPGQKLLLPN